MNINNQTKVTVNLKLSFTKIILLEKMLVCPELCVSTIHSSDERVTLIEHNYIHDKRG